VGVPVHDDRKHFEMLLLEGAQAGLAWDTILLRREGYRKAFAGFDPRQVASFSPRTKAALMKDAGLSASFEDRRGCDERSTLSGCPESVRIIYRYVRRFVDGKPKINRRKTMTQILVMTAESNVLSGDLQRRSFRFVGSTIIYAYMQAVGLVNDHTRESYT
jgi:DNA-3-methyladenine glycosylase I